MEVGNKKHFKNLMKVQQIIKQTSPFRQLFKTVNFIYMKIIDFFSHNSPPAGLSLFLI